MPGEEIITIVGTLKLLPEIVEAGKQIWKSLRAPEQVSKGKDGVSGDTYYSEQHKFKVSIPDENWRFWKPTPQFLSSIGATIPTIEIPIVVISKNMVRLFRPNVVVTVDDVGTLINIEEVVAIGKEQLESQGATIDEENVIVSISNSSAVLIATSPYFGGETRYCVQQIYIHTGKAYTISANYVPVSDRSNAMFGGMQEILHSFQFIK
jgi:hypothetical protein